VTPLIEGDETTLTQLFVNLLVNAAQSIDQVARKPNEIQIRTRTDGGRAVVEVQDTGCGISHELEGRVFDPFYTTKPVGTGTGLGLFISRCIVEAHSGTITFDSEVGRGTTFRVSLPAARHDELNSSSLSSFSRTSEAERCRAGAASALGPFIVREVARAHELTANRCYRVDAGARHDLLHPTPTQRIVLRRSSYRRPGRVSCSTRSGPEHSSALRVTRRVMRNFHHVARCLTAPNSRGVVHYPALDIGCTSC
jgi:hypothetical protein